MIPPGVVVLAGGGPEGEIGDEGAWSVPLYKALLERGDITGDGQVRVVVLSTTAETDWLPRYFEWLGADEAVNLAVGSRDAADSKEVAQAVQDADAVFLKGGDQGEIYDLWADSRLVHAIGGVHALGGGVGGTSAGAMLLGYWAFAGGQDLVSADVLADAQTPYLDDPDGDPSIKWGFLGLAGQVLIDTHFTERGRLGRLLGVWALSRDLYSSPGMALGIDQQTGVVMQTGGFEVFGLGSVALLRHTEQSDLYRYEGYPLMWTPLSLDLLVEGWEFESGVGLVAPAGAGVTASVHDAPQPGWAVDGNNLDHDECFGVTVDLGPYLTRPGTCSSVLEGAVGFVDANHPDWRADIQESLFAALRDNPGLTAFFVGETGALSPDPDDPARVRFGLAPDAAGPEQATVIIDSSGIWAAGSSPWVSAYDAGDGSLRAAGLAGLRVHVLADTELRGLVYDLSEHTVVRSPLR